HFREGPSQIPRCATSQDINVWGGYVQPPIIRAAILLVTWRIVIKVAKQCNHDGVVFGQENSEFGTGDKQGVIVKQRAVGLDDISWGGGQGVKQRRPGNVRRG